MTPILYCNRITSSEIFALNRFDQSFIAGGGQIQLIHAQTSNTGVQSLSNSTQLHPRRTSCLSSLGRLVCTYDEEYEYQKRLFVFEASVDMIMVWAAVVLNISAPKLDPEEIRAIKSFLKKINEEGRYTDFKDTEGSGFGTQRKLEDFHEYINELDKGGRMRHLFEDVDKVKLKGKKWTDCMTKAFVTLQDGKKRITWIDSNHATQRTGYKENVMQKNQ